MGIKDELSWLENVSQSEGDSSPSWSKFHANANCQPSTDVGLNAIMPLINHKVSTLKAQ